MRSLSGNEKENGKVGSPILPHTNFSLRAGQINQLILLVDAQFLGMKGGTSFKASLQIVNVEKPDSVRNSCFFALFEAPDSAVNLHLALDQFQKDIGDLQKEKRRQVHV